MKPHSPLREFLKISQIDCIYKLPMFIGLKKPKLRKETQPYSYANL